MTTIILSFESSISFTLKPTLSTEILTCQTTSNHTFWQNQKRASNVLLEKTSLHERQFFKLQTNFTNVVKIIVNAENPKKKLDYNRVLIAARAAFLH